MTGFARPAPEFLSVSADTCVSELPPKGLHSAGPGHHPGQARSCQETYVPASHQTVSAENQAA